MKCDKQRRKTGLCFFFILTLLLSGCVSDALKNETNHTSESANETDMVTTGDNAHPELDSDVQEDNEQESTIPNASAESDAVSRQDTYENEPKLELDRDVPEDTEVEVTIPTTAPNSSESDTKETTQSQEETTSTTESEETTETTRETYKQNDLITERD